MSFSLLKKTRVQQLVSLITFVQIIMKGSKAHVCGFARRSKILDTLYPPDSKLSRIKRSFREIFLISEANGRKCFTHKGNAGYIYEKEKQLTQYFHMIHPYSKFRQYWELFAIIELCVTIIIRFYIVCLCPTLVLNYGYQIFIFMSDVFETSDALLLFLVGYIDKETQEVEFEPRKVFLYYIQKFYFHLNLILSIPVEFFVHLYNFTVGPPHVIFKYWVLTKIFKIFSMIRYIRHLSKIYNLSELKTILFWGIIIQLLLCHWITCLFYLVLYDEGEVFNDPNYLHAEYEGSFFYYLKSFYIIYSLILKRNGYLYQHPIETIVHKCLWLISVVIVYFYNIVLGGFLIQFLALVKTSNVFYDEMIQEVQKFLAQENLPKHIHEKVMKYLQFRFRHTYFVEKVILSTLSPPLKREVVNFLCFNLLIHPKSIFNGIPKDMATDLCLLMRYEIFLPGDIIFRAGGKADEMFFLYSGSVAVYSQKGKEIMHWYEGQQFGASAFVGNTVHPVTVIALEMSECYILRYSDFLKTSAESPEYIEMLSKAAYARRKFIMEIYAED